MSDIQLYPIHIRLKNDRVFEHTRPGATPILTSEFKKWMDGQVGSLGSRIDDYADWFCDPRVHHYHDPHNKEKGFYYHTIWLKDPKHHMMIKLTWGGS